MNLNSNSNVPLSTVLKKLQDAANTPFEKSYPIPAEASHSVEFYKHEQNKIFTSEWICIGREDEIPNAGDYITHDIAGVPIFVLRQRTKEILGFVNACAHRFTCLLSDTTGNRKLIICPYHAWTYDLDGSLKSAPFMKMKDSFNLSDHKLRKLQTEIWEGFIYVTLDESPTRSVKASLKVLKSKIVGRYDMSSYITVMRKTMEWRANWKNLIENFIESYHVPIAHQKTFAKHKKLIEDYICGEDSNHYCYHYAPQKSETGLGAAHSKNTKLKGLWRRMMVDFCVFPNHLITLMPDYLWFISVQPIAIDKFTATWGFAIPPEVRADFTEKEFDKWRKQLLNYMDIANNEDKIVVEGLHRGTSSSNLPKGTFHPIERNVWQFIRYLARITK